MAAVDVYLVRLNCVETDMWREKGKREDLGIFIRRGRADDQYTRVTHNGQSHIWVLETQNMWDCVTWEDRRTDSVRPAETLDINVQACPSLHESIFARQKCINGYRMMSPHLTDQFDPGKSCYAVSGCNWDAETCIMSPKLDKHGTVGMCELVGQHYGIEVLKLGFDFGYNPVCFVATSSGRSERFTFKQAGNSSKDRYSVQKSKVHWHQEVNAQLPGIDARTPFDVLGWSEIVDSNARPLRQHPGLWALKGDRINGLDVQLSDLGCLKIQRSSKGEMMVWDVQLYDLKPSRIAPLRRKTQR